MRKFSLLAGLGGALTLALMAACPAAATPNTYIFGYTPSGSQQLILNGGSWVLNATQMGWYDSTGSGNAAGNYTAGNCQVLVCFGPPYQYHDYFVFDLARVDVPITSASLSLGNPIDGFAGDPAAYVSWDVTTSAAVVTSGGGGLPTYHDLGSGIAFAKTLIGPFDNATQVVIGLNAAAIAALNAAKGGQFVVGGSVTGVPEPATWATLLAGFGALGCVLRLRRRSAVRAAG
jgi:hypothetical protein